MRLLDVSDLTSVRKFADQIIQEEENLHILVRQVKTTEISYWLKSIIYEMETIFLQCMKSLVYVSSVSNVPILL